MNLIVLINTLASQGFSLTPAGCNAIELAGPVATLTPELRQALADHKPSLLAMLEASRERHAIQREGEAPPEATAFPFGANARCVAHLDPDQWEEVPMPNRPGWLRSTCRVCGTFIGCRPEG